MYIALGAYAAYVANATQFVLKLRTARLESQQRTIGPIGRSMKYAE